ncbi:MAG: phenylalanine--tRNA ligase subunit alpha [Phototrophicales bacterium]|nr:MAG: phenylalanine--tRNA ligase subunit alpha [Phototrophicales bacterium]RMG75470.1 MAG: phenylalanine--tRNA ligase subunit alpha [Chloroflexota bacterium]
MLDQLEKLREEALQALDTIQDEASLQSWAAQFIGKKGAVTQALRGMGQLPKEERPAFGKLANDVKVTLEAAYAEREAMLEAQRLAHDLEEGEIDITLPGRTLERGRLHPATQTLRRFYRIWGDMGFQVYRSRDVETDEMNFTMLNMPPHHPARDMQDTFYTTEPNIILRTHTSAGQIRAMRELGENGTQPIRVILPGMCYRYEQITARSEVQFHQVEGLVIGRNIRMSDLKGTITEFARRMFGAETQVRFRASYFPFTEPSMEVDVSSADERLTKGTGWLEIAGCGMVHPVVLRNGGYDPSVWSGFAFGMGPERITMQRHDIRDIRMFWGNDLRFLKQF